MANLVRCVLADLSHTLPMPDRDHQLFSQSEHGRIVDIEKPFYRAVLADGSIVRHPDPKAAEQALKEETDRLAAEAAEAAAIESSTKESDAGAAGNAKSAKGAKS